MKPRLRSAINLFAAAFFGAALCAGGIYFFFIRPFFSTNIQSGYYTKIAEARLTTRELELLRKGEHEKLSALLESTLDAHLLDAALLEKVAPSLRDKQVVNSMYFVRQYRLEYPSQLTEKTHLELLQHMLAPPQNGL